MKHVLVTGGRGQLGNNLRRIADSYSDYRFSFIDVDDLDLTRGRETKDFLNHIKPEYIINCAAFTAVDQAEKQPEIAFRINSDVPQLLGEIALKNKIRTLHISTDYVYDGRLSVPHREEEVPAPVSVYARSKYSGEKALHDNNMVIIIRTSWLYSEFGNNFLNSMIRLGKERKELGVVFDQTGTPTYAGDLAEALMSIITFSERKAFLPGIYNFSNEGVCSWYDFAMEIMKQGQINCRIKPIRTSEYLLPAQRPVYSVMDKTKVKRTFDIQIPYWKDSLITAFQNLKKKEEI
jgi:dTDP-4-dehydrorhamnose reductase